ncbi:hypothetical protein EBT31_16995 [bacterium]|jgi:hypothetical protein|nr:hypothetical protein [bacterium]
MSNISLSRPEHLISLASSGLCVTVNVSLWGATKQSEELASEVTTMINADKNAAKVTRNLLANHPRHKALTNYRATINNWLKRRTYTFNDALRYVATVDMENFLREYQEHEKVFLQLGEEFYAEYPSIVSDMAFKQGTAFNRADYPDLSVVKAKTKIVLYTYDVPQNDFRQMLAHELADDLHKSYTRQVNDIVQRIMGEQADRFVSVMESISHCCGTEEVQVKDKDGVPTGEVKTKKRKIYDTTIQRAQEFCKTFEQFNLTHNPELEAARVALSRALDGVDAESLRDSEAMRNSVKTEVDDILNKFKPMQFSAADLGF